MPAASDDVPVLTAETLGAAALRALGLPQSRELPEPPAVCPWPAPAVVVDTYGERPRAAGLGAVEAEGDEYLKSLESLGYL